jgi:hypothetical protein
METATITLTRRDESDIKQREVFVSLDGERFATLLFGETVTRQIPAGQHRIRAHNTLVWKTIEFTVAAGGRVTFRLINRPGWGTYAMLALLGTGPLYLTFDKVGE